MRSCSPHTCVISCPQQDRQQQRSVVFLFCSLTNGYWRNRCRGDRTRLSTRGTAPSTSGLPLSIASIPLLPTTATAGVALTLPSSSASLPAPLLQLTAPPSSGPLPPPFHLASSFSPIPGKLVRRIQALEFVEMRDLLLDNIALAERLEALPTHRSPAKAPETREVGALGNSVLHLHRGGSSSAPGACQRHASLHVPSSTGGSKISRHWVGHV